MCEISYIFTDSESVDAAVAGTSRTYSGNDVTRREMRLHHVMHKRWPYHSGCTQLLLGLVLSFLGNATVTFTTGPVRSFLHTVDFYHFFENRRHRTCLRQLPAAVINLTRPTLYPLKFILRPNARCSCESRKDTAG